MKAGDLVRVRNIQNLAKGIHDWVPAKFAGLSYGVILRSDRESGFKWQLHWFDDDRTPANPYWGVDDDDIEPAGDDVPAEVWAQLARLKLEGRL